jgi:tRNA dimethylallyltransferase
VSFSQKKMVVMVGPTAVGKTALAIRVAKHFGTEIISADSRQLYKELTIGTAKPALKELSEVKHHFVNSLSIAEEYNAAQFGEEAFGLACELFEDHDYLVVCGGSGLYVRALLEGFDDIPEIPDEIRGQLQEEYEKNGLIWLQAKITEIDPLYSRQIDLQNPQRLMRALEVKMATGQSIGSFQKREKRALPFRVIKIGLELVRTELYNRIEQRLDGMIETGLFAEAEQLYPFRNHNALQTVGYQEVFDFLEGKCDQEEAIRLLKRNTRRYAKRQLTWFKRDKEISWFDPGDFETIIHAIEQF